ncbi:MAG: hypothetical protein MUQ10_19765, partial [Anaerolineae bacterium]|nr:hypothetical protein [Anaerolineae bacterium]
MSGAREQGGFYRGWVHSLGNLSASSTMTLRINEAVEWGEVGDHVIPTRGAVTWFDEGTPWAVFEV